MPKEMESHIIICNWHDRGDRILKEFHSALAAPDAEILVITDRKVNEKALRLSPAYESMFFIESDPTLHDVLKRARTHLAAGVILLADDEFPAPDAKTALIALALAKLITDLPQRPYIVAEVMKHHKIEHLLDAGIDEWGCSNDYGSGILAQSALYGNLSQVYQHLLIYSEQTNEMYCVDDRQYSHTLRGKFFSELAGCLNDHIHLGNPSILLGIKCHDDVILNPKAGEFD